VTLAPLRAVIRSPASSANLGPGFDALGLALGLHLELGPWVEGEGHPKAVDGHPGVLAFRAAGGEGPLWVRSAIPMGRGLGFSGAARVAGLLAAHAQRAGAAFDRAGAQRAVLAHAAVLEGHADNVAASLLGGLVATAAGRAVRVPLAVRPAVVVWVPVATTSTDQSRAALRATVGFTDAVFNVGRTALLVAALAAGEVEALRDATADRLHQDARLERAPGSRAALDSAMGAGAWCGWLSGSGPSIAALCDAAAAAAVAAALPTDGTALVLDVDEEGTVVRALAVDAP
jgi:homoserine kinase